MTNDYLKTLYGDVNDGMLVIWQKKGPTTFFPISEMERAEAFMLAASATKDTYFGWALQSPNVTSGRGTSDTASAVPGVFMDIDVKSPIKGVHSKNDNLPESYQHVLDFITQELGLPEPAAIRGSGNGAYFDWLYDTPWIFKDDEQRIEAQSLSTDLQQIIITATSAKFNWKLDNTSDLARVTRLPGTLNHKTTPPKGVTLIRLNEALRVTPAELREAVDTANRRLATKPKATPAPRKRAEPHGSKISTEWQDGVAPDYGPIAAGCSYFRFLEENKEQLSEPDWYKAASIMPRCKNGTEKFHDFSRADPRYSYDETERKIAHALQFGPRTCSNIQAEANHEGCSTCPFNGLISSPIALGYRPLERVAVLASHAFELATNRYLSLDDFTPYDVKTMNNRFASTLGSPHQDLIRDPALRQVSRVEYLPGEMNLFVQMDRHTVLNKWKPGPLTPAEGDFSILSEHFSYLFSHEDRSHVMNVLAHSLQRPREKIAHAIVICGTQGTGKSFLGHLAKHIYGTQNVKVVGAETLADRWSADVGECQALFAEELDVHHLREAYEKMKVLISEETMQVEQKHMPRYRATTPKVIIMSTNHFKSIALPGNDRRYFIARSDAEPRDGSYYNRLFTEGLAQAPAFMHYLLNMDISNFNAKAPPPMNDAKRELISQSRPPLVQAIEKLVEEADHPFHRDLIGRTSAFHALEPHYRDYRLTETSISNAFGELGFEQLPQMRLPDGRKVRLWIIRNSERWKRATPQEVQDELNRQE